MWTSVLLKSIVKVLILPLEKCRINAVPLNVKNDQQTECQLGYCCFVWDRGSCFALFVEGNILQKKNYVIWSGFLVVKRENGYFYFVFLHTYIPLCSLPFCPAEKKNQPTIKWDVSAV